MYRYEHNNWGIQASGAPVTFSFDIKENEIILQNDQPVVLNIPKPKNGSEAILYIYEDNELIDTLKGLKSWVNDEQLEFRLSKGYAKAVIKFQSRNNEK